MYRPVATPLQDDPGDEQRDARGRVARRSGEREDDLHDDADDDDVGEGPDARALAQRDPQQEDERADDAHPPADAEPGPAFSVDGTFENHLRLPFTAPPAQLAAAVAALAELDAGLGAGSERRATEPEPAALV